MSVQWSLLKWITVNYMVWYFLWYTVNRSKLKLIYELISIESQCANDVIVCALHTHTQSTDCSFYDDQFLM